MFQRPYLLVVCFSVTVVWLYLSFWVCCPLDTTATGNKCENQNKDRKNGDILVLMWFCNGKKTSKDTKYSQGKQTDWVTTSLTIIFLEKAFTRSFEFLVWSCFLFLWLFTTAWNSRFWILIDKSFDSGKISPQVVVQKMGETTCFNPKQSKIWNYCLLFSNVRFCVVAKVHS